MGPGWCLQKVQAQLVSQNFVVSWADLFQLGGAAGLIATGGPTIDIVMGRKCEVPHKFIHARTVIFVLCMCKRAK